VLSKEQKENKTMEKIMTIRDDGSIPTVSVVVMVGDVLDSCTAFPDTEEGNKKSEELFKKTVKKIRITSSEEDLKYYLEEGYFAPQGWDSGVFITHT
jgi:hypothetical protein